MLSPSPAVGDTDEDKMPQEEEALKEKRMLFTRQNEGWEEERN